MTQVEKLCEAIKASLYEMERCPDDSTQEIWNEMLEEWETGLKMDSNRCIGPTEDD